MNTLLTQRNILPLIDNGQSWQDRRSELIDILSKNIYGYTPTSHSKAVGCIVSEEFSYGGKILEQKIEVSFDTPKGTFTFPFMLFVPRSDKALPVFVYLSFFQQVPNKFLPCEEICDRGFAVASVCYEDIVPDSHDGDYSKALAGMFAHDGERHRDEWGKIGMWAYGASRVIDVLCERDDIDKRYINIIGHSRLGKTALWCSAQDERIFCTVSNNSGYGGAALSKGGSGECITMFEEAGSWDWFCPAFTDYSGRDNDKNYDQHFLLSLIAPRYLCVGSGAEDWRADPESEYLACVAASEAYQMYNLGGIDPFDGVPLPETVLHSGEIGYHIRSGGHFLSRYDWNRYMDFITSKMQF